MKPVVIQRACIQIGILVCLFALAPNVVAKEPGLQPWIEQLGAASFKERRAAKEAIRDQLAERPAEVVPVLKKLLGETDDPEIRFNLNFLLKDFRHGIPVASFKFDQELYHAGKWKLSQVAGPGQKIQSGDPKFFKDGSVEIDSLKVPMEAYFFSRSITSKNARHLTVFEAKVKIIDSGNRKSCAVLTLEDDVHGENVIIDAEGVATYNRKSNKVKIKTVGVWRTYRLEGAEDTLRVFIDDAKKPALQVPWTRHPAAPPKQQVRFGDTGSLNGSRVLYKDVKVLVYEKKNP